MTKEIWIAELDVENYRSFKPTPEFFEKWLRWSDKFHEERLFAQEWEPVEMILFEGEEGEKRKERKKPIPDFSGGYVVDACSERARTILEPLIAGQVEFLPLITPVGRYYEMNIQRLDCLDEQRSVVKRFKDGSVMRAIKYAFRWDRLEVNTSSGFES
jgi:hypothetical protein